MSDVFEVSLFGSHPDENNDDYYMGEEYPTLELALHAFNNPEEAFGKHCDSSCAYVEINGPNYYSVRLLSTFKPNKADENWKRELAMEAGMLSGVDAYNDFME